MGQFDLDIIKEEVNVENNSTINGISTNLIIENICRSLKNTSTKKLLLKLKILIIFIRYVIMYQNVIILIYI